MPQTAPRVLIATSNAGKLRDFAGVATPLGQIIESLPRFDLLTEVLEDGPTFEANARKKAAEYSLHAPGEIVLADDSVTTRALEKSILEGAGYEVLAAIDGSEAWRLLQDHGADLVVTDVEMPRMDGFALTEACFFYGLVAGLIAFFL